MVAGSDVEFGHLLPKVMVPFETRGTATPRKVVIQRKRRQFAQQDIPSLLQREGCDPAAAEATKRAASTLDVSIFDNTDWETRTPAEWVPKAPGVPPSPATVATFAADGSVSWVDATVVDYDAAANRYLVQTAGSSSGDNADGGALASIHRLHVCFKAEDPELFSRRMAEAYATRARAEALMRYHLCIDCMPTDDVPTLTTEQVNRILSYALNSKALKDRLLDTSQVRRWTDARTCVTRRAVHLLARYVR